MKSRISRRYLAGLLDGEGYISIRPDKSSRSNDRSHYKPCVKIALIDKTAYLLFEIKDVLGGHIHCRPSKKEKHNISYCWEVQTFTTVERVLNYVYPYLILKKEQARIVLDLIKTKRGGRVNGTGRFETLTPVLINKRLRLYNLVKKLNHRGCLPAETKRETPTDMEGEAIVRSPQECGEQSRNALSLDTNVLSHN